MNSSGALSQDQACLDQCMTIEPGILLFGTVNVEGNLRVGTEGDSRSSVARRSREGRYLYP